MTAQIQDRGVCVPTGRDDPRCRSDWKTLAPPSLIPNGARYALAGHAGNGGSGVSVTIESRDFLTTGTHYLCPIKYGRINKRSVAHRGAPRVIPRKAPRAGARRSPVTFNFVFPVRATAWAPQCSSPACVREPVRVDSALMMAADVIASP